MEFIEDDIRTALLADPAVDADDIETVSNGVDQEHDPGRRPRDDAPPGDRRMSRADETVWECRAEEGLRVPAPCRPSRGATQPRARIRPRDLRQQPSIEDADHHPRIDPRGDPGMSKAIHRSAKHGATTDATATMVSLIASLADNKAALGRRFGEWAVSARRSSRRWRPRRWPRTSSAAIRRLLLPLSLLGSVVLLANSCSSAVSWSTRSTTCWPRFLAMPDDVAAHLTIAGQCDDPRRRCACTRSLEGAAQSPAALGPVPGDEVAQLLGDADVVVLPFRRVAIQRKRHARTVPWRAADRAGPRWADRPPGSGCPPLRRRSRQGLSMPWSAWPVPMTRHWSRCRLLRAVTRPRRRGRRSRKTVSECRLVLGDVPRTGPRRSGAQDSMKRVSLAASLRSRTTGVGEKPIR